MIVGVIVGVGVGVCVTGVGVIVGVIVGVGVFEGHNPAKTTVKGAPYSSTIISLAQT